MKRIIKKENDFQILTSVRIKKKEYEWNVELLQHKIEQGIKTGRETAIDKISDSLQKLSNEFNGIFEETDTLYENNKLFILNMMKNMKEVNLIHQMNMLELLVDLCDAKFYQSFNSCVYLEQPFNESGLLISLALFLSSHSKKNKFSKIVKCQNYVFLYC